MIKRTDILRVNNHLTTEVVALAKHGISIAVDFDSTIALTDGYPNIVRPNGNVFQVLHKWQHDLGCKILLHTMRHGKDLEAAVVWCANCGFTFDGVNVNPENEERDPGCKKMYATFYIDDKAFGTPLLYDTTGVLKDHVDWETIDMMYTPFLKTLVSQINKKKQEHEQ